MSDPAKQTPELFRFSERVTFLPIINGSGQFSAATRRFMLEHQADCLAVPLPPSFASDVEAGVLDLPHPSIVIQRPRISFDERIGISNNDDGSSEDGSTEDSAASYVPIDPCQAVITAIRAAMGERIPRHYIDLETNRFIPFASIMPDPFAVRDVALDKFAAAVLPSITPPPDRATKSRMVHMAAQIVELEQKYRRILVVDSILHWPWIRHEYNKLSGVQPQSQTPGIKSDSQIQFPEHDEVNPTQRHSIDSRTLMFLFGELPLITAMYERARQQLDDDESLLIDGVKELLLAARNTYRSELAGHGRRITPALLSKCLQYIRNLSLIHRRMTPDLITIVIASKQIFGDAFALHVAENANHYAFAADGVDSQTSPKSDPQTDLDIYRDSYAGDDSDEEEHLDQVTLGIDQARLPGGDVVSLVSRLPGSPMSWTTLKLKPRPPQADRDRWRHTYNPYGQCSYPPEDTQIENFRTRVFERAQALVGNELARTEKFTTSVRDGIDIRDTLRHWYEKQIYVKVIPPSRGTLDACVMLFDAPADPRKYPWRTTWFAEHKDESTLAFYATNYTDELVGPNIGLAIYGGALFLYPPVLIKDIWYDEALDFAETLEERLIAAACLYSRSKQVALLSPLPPGGAWRRMARHYKKQLVHVPMSGFSDEQVQHMRRVHVLGGKDVRSYAAEFIRRI